VFSSDCRADGVGWALLTVTSAQNPRDVERRHSACWLAARSDERRNELRIRIPTAWAGSIAILLAASGQAWPAISVLAIGLLAEIAAAAATAVHGAGDGLRDGLRQRLRRLASGGTRDDRD
jgi:hypothetical protein